MSSGDSFIVQKMSITSPIPVEDGDKGNFSPFPYHKCATRTPRVNP